MFRHATARPSEHAKGRSVPVLPVAVLAALLVVGGFWLMGCDAESPAAAPRAVSESDADMCDDPDAPDAAAGAELLMERVTIVSNDGSYRLTVEPETGRIPRNRYFALSITVEGIRQPIELGSTALSVSGGMPHHEHGLNTRPIVDAADDPSSDRSAHTLSARVHGLLLHMPGRWELYFDITEAGMTERAQFTIELP